MDTLEETDPEIAEEVQEYVEWLIMDIENEFCDEPMDTDYIANLIGNELAVKTVKK